MQTGDRLGHYEIRSKLGAGGMGEVYLADDSRLGRPVALKILTGELATDPSRRARFDLEARAASALNHPHIAHIYDVGEQDGTYFIAMEYVEGEDLSRRLAGGALDQDTILAIAIQVADALEAARGKGIIHRDIKPANIALTSRGDVKVLDFGLAKMTEPVGPGADEETRTQSQTVAGTVLGTVRYMSPEQVRGETADTRSDLFSLGVVLYEMVAGRPPFAGSSSFGTQEAIVNQQPEPLRELNDSVPPELERIILKCLQKDPEHRYQTPRDLVVDLRNLQRSDSGSVTVIPPRRKSRSFLPALVIPAIIILAVAAWYLSPRTEGNADALAVLPFENETGDPELDYLCNGVTESLINTMAQFRELKVISRRSAFAMQGRDLDPATVGRELDVDVVLFGRLLQKDGVLTVSTELVDTRDSHQLWGSRISRSAGEIQSIEEEITLKVAERLGLKDLDDRSRTVRDPEAYRLYLKGLEFTTGTQREMDKAIEYFQDATRLDPNYALAYAGLARAYTTQSYLRGNERDERVELARTAALTALSLDPDLGDAWTAIGSIKMYFDLDWEGAEADLRKGVELSPGSVPSVMAFGDYLLFKGEYEDALVHYSRAMELDPLSVGAAHDMAISYMALHNYEQSERYFKMAIDLNPNWTWGYIKLAKTYSHLDRCDEALVATASAEELLAGSGTPAARCWLAFTYARCGEEDKARSALADLQNRSESEYVDPSIYSVIYLGLGDIENAIRGFEESIAERSPNLVYIRPAPDLYLDELADDPRYQAMLQKIGL
ncbi:MAG: protein kinase [Acidobacteria bacterium]|uniref:non-specific serine/threonine protein kinase n=1 Tax=Candidatus Polarisedimenticola svalbardensis TaxID=2886004 RepID=A0A8J6Y3G3_9BACT|nr:protein kinase [Candidatus Polarisedimenticola svalbardensis]